MNEILQSAIDEAKRNAESVHSGWSCTLLAYVEEVEAAALDARNAREMYKRGNTQIIIERERYREALESITALRVAGVIMKDGRRAEAYLSDAEAVARDALERIEGERHD